MRKNKYLDELGIPRKVYMGNFVKKRKLRRWNERRKYGFDYGEVINMDIAFAEWLYAHLRHFLKYNISDLSFHSISFEGKEYTIGEAVEVILEITAEFLQKLDVDEDVVETMEEEDQLDKKLEFAARLWSVIMGYLWI